MARAEPNGSARRQPGHGLEFIPAEHLAGAARSIRQDAARYRDGGGADFIHGQVQPVIDDDGAVCGLTVCVADCGTIDIQSEMVLDCSGQHTYFANIGVTGPKFVGNYDKQMAIFSWVAGTIRDDTKARARCVFWKTPNPIMLQGR